MKECTHEKIYLHPLLLFVLIMMWSCGGGGSSSGSGISSEAYDNIGPSGGILEISDQSNPLFGLKIDVPDGALDNETIISASIETNDSILPQSCKKVGQIFSFKPDNTVFNIPVKVTIPYDNSLTKNEDVLQIFSFDGSTWELATCIERDTNANTITILTCHFSKYVPLEPESVQYNTGFRPDKNGFSSPTKNFTCSGMVGYAKWFYENNESCELYNSYSNSEQEQIAIDSQNEMRNVVILRSYRCTDKMVGDALKEGLRTTHRPQILTIRSSLKGNPGDQLGHAVLVYDFKDNAFLIYDPDYPYNPATPNSSNRSIGYQNGILDDYYFISGENASNVDIDYVVASESLIYMTYDSIEKIFDKYPAACMTVYVYENHPYEVWGGNSLVPDWNMVGFYDAPQYGYIFIGESETTSSFSIVNYKYIVIGTRFGFYLDAIKLPTGGYLTRDDIVWGGNVHLPGVFPTATSGKIYNDRYICGAPDGQYNEAGFIGIPAYGTDFSGFIAISNPIF